MFGNEQFLTSDVWKVKHPQYQCLKKPKSSIPNFGKDKLLEFQSLKMQK